MRLRVFVPWIIALFIVPAIGLAPAALLAEDPPEAEDTATAAAPPEPVTTEHEITLDDRSLAYRARVEVLELTDGSGTPRGHLFTVAYMADEEQGEAEDRPVTFFMNGGPGAASAYLHVGGLGPKTLRTDGMGQPVDGGTLEENLDTWLAFTDMVFLDPIGTGFSRPVEAGDDRYYGHGADLDSLSQAIELWLDGQDRRASPVYLAGESYGGYRAAALPKRMMHDRGVQLAGTVLISPVIDFSSIRHSPERPLSWALLLPSYAAAAAGHGKAESAEPEALSEFALTDYIAALIHPERMEALFPKLAAMTGLDASFLRERRGRVGPNEFRRRLLADEGKVVSAYDGLLTVPDPTPSRAHVRVDQILDGMTPAYVTGFLDHLRRNLEWREGRDYTLLSRSVNRAWSYGLNGRQGYLSAMEDLQEVMALAPEFRVLTVHGESDLVTPWLASHWLLAQVNDALGGVEDRLAFARYSGGHMFYMRPDASTALARDAAAFYGAAVHERE